MVGGMEVGIGAEISIQRALNMTSSYIMNHIQVMMVKFGKVETNLTLETLEMTQEKIKCQY